MGIAVDAERVGDTLDADVLIEAVVVAVGGVDLEVAPPVGDGGFQGGIVSLIGRTDRLDVADQAVNDLGGLGVGLAVHGVNDERRRVLACVVDDLADERRQAVDRQTGAMLKLTLVAHVEGPLLAQPGKAYVVQARDAVIRLMLYAELERLLGVGDEVGVFGHQPIQLPVPARSRVLALRACSGSS